MDNSIRAPRTNKLKNYSSLENELTEFKQKLIETVKLLKAITISVMPDKSFVENWDKLIEDWINSDLPLYVRKHGDKYPRGSEIKHKSGRILIPVDNGPAHWALSMCINQNLIGIKEVKHYIDQDQIPVAMILNKKEKLSKYKCTKHLIDNPNKKGWKVAHIEQVGLNTRQSLNEIDIGDLEKHFKDFMSPSNMFLIPLLYAGLAEVEEVISVFK